MAILKKLKKMKMNIFKLKQASFYDRENKQCEMKIRC